MNETIEAYSDFDHRFLDKLISLLGLELILETKKTAMTFLTKESLTLHAGYIHGGELTVSITFDGREK